MYKADFGQNNRTEAGNQIINKTDIGQNNRTEAGIQILPKLTLARTT
jgi:hypothetical protein